MSPSSVCATYRAWHACTSTHTHTHTSTSTSTYVNVSSITVVTCRTMFFGWTFGRIRPLYRIITQLYLQCCVHALNNHLSDHGFGADVWLHPSNHLSNHSTTVILCRIICRIMFGCIRLPLEGEEQAARAHPAQVDAGILLLNLI